MVSCSGATTFAAKLDICYEVTDHNEKDPFSLIRKQIKKQISEQYSTVERFAFENDVPKSTLSRFLNGSRKEYSVISLVKIAKALGKHLTLKIE
jgi:predicted transcriptional regulator